MGLISDLKSREQEKKIPEPEVKSEAWTGCQTCGSARAWVDVYGGGPHCAICNPPTAKALVRKIVDSGASQESEHATELVNDSDLDDFEFWLRWRYWEYRTRKGETRAVWQRRDFRWT